MEAKFSDYSYLSIHRVFGGGFVVEGQSNHLPPSDVRMKIGDYVIVSKNWKGQRCYISAYLDGRKIFDGCYIGLREWSSDMGRMASYAINFEKVIGSFVSQDLADALVIFLKKVW
jgi:hypothetical protein